MACEDDIHKVDILIGLSVVAERMQCISDVCAICRGDSTYHERDLFEDKHGSWWHRPKGCHWPTKCKASNIHSRVKINQTKGE